MAGRAQEVRLRASGGRLGFGAVTFHSLRHTHKTWMAEHHSEAKVAELMGDLEQRWHASKRPDCPPPAQTRQTSGPGRIPCTGRTPRPTAQALRSAHPHSKHFRRQPLNPVPRDAQVSATTRAEKRNMGD